MTIAEYLSQSGLRQKELARRAGIVASILSKHLKHGAKLSPVTAKKIESASDGAIKAVDLVFNE